MLVEEIMTEDFETLSRDQTLRDVIKCMLKNNVDHVVVMEDDMPSAIITRRKVLMASYKLDRPPSKIPLSGFGRGLETMIDPDTSVLMSVAKLQKERSECLPVVDEMEIVGVLTKDNIIENVSNITDHIVSQDKRRDEWSYERGN